MGQMLLHAPSLKKPFPGCLYVFNAQPVVHRVNKSPGQLTYYPDFNTRPMLPSMTQASKIWPRPVNRWSWRLYVYIRDRAWAAIFISCA